MVLSKKQDTAVMEERHQTAQLSQQLEVSAQSRVHKIILFFFFLFVFCLLSKKEFSPLGRESNKEQLF
jgi:hypothetical protein